MVDEMFPRYYMFGKADSNLQPHNYVLPATNFKGERYPTLLNMAMICREIVLDSIKQSDLKMAAALYLLFCVNTNIDLS